MLTARAWFLVSLAVYVVVVGFAWLVLPDGRIPLHFGPGGRADRFGSRNEASVALLVVGLSVSLVFWLVAEMVPRMPVQRINVPHQEYWSAPERRPRMRRMVATDLFVLAAMTNVLLCLVVLATVGAVLDGSYSLGWYGWGTLGLYLAALAGWVGHLYRRYHPPRGA